MRPPRLPRAPCAGIALLVSAAAAAAEPAGISDDERRDAGCIDTYNDPSHVDPDEVAFHRNAAVASVVALGGAGAASGGDRAAARGLGYGGRIDLDAPILAFLSSAATDTGFIGGVSGAALAVPGDSRTYGGELRLGIARRTYGVAWSSLFGRCVRRRVHLGIDLLRWSAGAFTDLALPGRPTAFVSSVGFPAVVYRRMSPLWGFGVSATAAEFRLAPSFEWGASAAAELHYRWAVLAVTLGGHFAPDPAVLGTLGLGAGFEL
jgi:hypothetical protein